MMVKLAKAGKHVVRLKSGDPMIFGRGGEEISRLEAAGIPVDIVPGITAALAMAAALGVSLTHRDHAQSVRFVTGHARDGKLPANLDWQSMAGSAATTIFYMGGGTAGQIAARLIMEGLSPDTPVAVAASISRPDERLLRGLLSDLAELAKAVGTTGPVLVGVGWSFATASAAATTMPCHAAAENLAWTPSCGSLGRLASQAGTKSFDRALDSDPRRLRCRIRLSPSCVRPHRDRRPQRFDRSTRQFLAPDLRD